MMKGEWIILLWALLGSVFLLKTTPVRRLVCNVRRQPPAVQATVALCLLIAVINGSTKPGGTNEVSGASPSRLPESPETSLETPLAGMPVWWPHDAADTDGDGIPDLWEKWTHGNRHVEDSAIDRDDDGLTDLEEFWNQTDPRTADTDGDGFGDAFEVANGMDPLVQEDFTPVEPDVNTNGVVDIWENAPYFGSFTDSDEDGFDDTYEMYYLEPASEDNYDVVVDVYTTRSAALTWSTTNATQGFVLQATAGTSIRLRLPFGEDTQIALLPAPEGDDPPAGQLWKSRLRLSFAPRDGQVAAGTCVVSADGDIQQKVVGAESTIARFPDVSLQMRAMAAGGYADDLPFLTLIHRRYVLIPEQDVYHAVDEVVGPFEIVNAKNIDEESVAWSADHGTMSPGTGFSSYLTVTSIPSGDDPIVVTASVVFDETFTTNRTALVTPCPRHVFSLDSCTENFAPQLGSNAVFSVTLPGCSHQNDAGWLEAEIVRETTAGVQHVAWVDLIPETEAPDQYRNAAELPSQCAFSWDGIAQANLPLADYPETFTQGKHEFNLAAPEIKEGQPVPPPYHTLAVRLLNPEKTQVRAEAKRRIHVPQVVQVKWETAAATLFQTPITFVSPTGQNTTVYSADYSGDSGTLMAETLARLQAHHPETVNIRFTPFYSTSDKTTKFLFIAPDIRKDVFIDDSGQTNEVSVFGITSPASLQQSALGKSTCYLGSICGTTFDLYAEAAKKNKPQPFPTPVSSSQMLEALCKVSAHEVGHALGLVDTHYLDGVVNRHNPGPNDQTKMMNVNTELEWLFNPHPPVGWRPLNLQYLEFVLPVPQ